MSRADVPRYSRVSARFWADEKSAQWSDRVKLAALYVMTCSHRHLEGIFKLPPEYACADLHWTLKSWKCALTVLRESGFLKWDSQTNVLLIINALRYQAPENPNQAEAAVRRIKELPDTPLLQEFCSFAFDFCGRERAGQGEKRFTQLLHEQLGERLGQQLHPLNLKSQSESEPQAKTETETLKRDRSIEHQDASRTVVSTSVGNGRRAAQGLSKIGSTVGDVLERFPHLRET